jgi:hypothetical protein
MRALAPLLFVRLKIFHIHKMALWNNFSFVTFLEMPPVTLCAGRSGKFLGWGALE